MSRLVRTAAAALAALAIAAPAADAQQAAELPVRDLTLPVVDLTLATESLDGAETVEEDEKEVKVTLASDVLFEFDRAGLSTRAATRLKALAQRIRRARPAAVRIDGHTDAKGPSGYNLDLSRRRAQAVRDALARSLGDDLPATTATGHGEADPVASNTRPGGGDDPRGRARNRRVTITYAR